MKNSHQGRAWARLWGSRELGGGSRRKHAGGIARSSQSTKKQLRPTSHMSYR